MTTLRQLVSQLEGLDEDVRLRIHQTVTELNRRQDLITEFLGDASAVPGPGYALAAAPVAETSTSVGDARAETSSAGADFALNPAAASYQGGGGDEESAMRTSWLVPSR